LISMQPCKNWVPSTGQLTSKKTPWDIDGKMSPKFALSKVLQFGLIALPQLVLIMLCLHFHYGWIQSTSKTHLNNHQTLQYLLSYHMSNLEWGNQILFILLFLFIVNKGKSWFHNQLSNAQQIGSQIWFVFIWISDLKVGF
jgi:hypothetical protein